MSVLDGPGEGTWSVFAMKVVEERDELRHKLAGEAAHIKSLEGLLVDACRERDEAAMAFERLRALHQEATRCWDFDVKDVVERAEKAEKERDEALTDADRWRAAHDTMRDAVKKLLLSRDAAWVGGHDWQEAVDDAIAALGIESSDDGE